MPQLDKYMFLDNVVGLSIFFILIYVFMRQWAIPEISTLLKFRKKKLVELGFEATYLEKLLKFSKFIFKKNIKIYKNRLLSPINLSINLFKIIFIFTEVFIFSHILKKDKKAFNIYKVYEKFVIF